MEKTSCQVLLQIKNEVLKKSQLEQVENNFKVFKYILKKPRFLFKKHFSQYQKQTYLGKTNKTHILRR